MGQRLCAIKFRYVRGVKKQANIICFLIKFKKKIENYLAAGMIHRKQIFQETVGFSIWVYLDNFGLHS